MSSGEIHWTFDGVKEWDWEPAQSPVLVVAGLPFVLAIFNNDAGFYVTLLCVSRNESEDWWADISYTLTLVNADPVKNRVEENEYTISFDDRYECVLGFEVDDDVLELKKVPKGFVNGNRLFMKASFTVHRCAEYPSRRPVEIDSVVDE
ncbi:hypothetical protein PFISCL1PPCAC_21187 [Pristionchus fissidentatus]|uniref:Uncharacterized protein n=1 Tax=Pristionchus fissidentatus TaxID=1538716 RepID=A0AAV5WH29_9BILA|nr:hypothetical protein PFISCL1PPCAC_21187 [Pristionchus fissidentatus]